MIELNNVNNLKMLHAIKRGVRRSSSKYRYYHFQVEAERLRLVELGECPTCVMNYCSFLTYGNLKRCDVCDSGQKALNLTVAVKPLDSVRVHPDFNNTIAA